MPKPNAKIKMERVMGIEPTQSAWKAEILPLNYTRSYQSDCSIITTEAWFVNTFFEKNIVFYIIFIVQNALMDYIYALQRDDAAEVCLQQIILLS